MLSLAGAAALLMLVAGLTIGQGHAEKQIGVYRVQPDSRLCPSELCAGSFISLVNQGTTPCADGEPRTLCGDALVDLDALGLGQEQRTAFQDLLNTDRALVSGWLDPGPVHGTPVRGTLRATEGWQGAPEAAPFGAVYRVKDNGIRCVAAPCFSSDAQVVNTAEAVAVSGVDYSQLDDGVAQHCLAMRNVPGDSVLVSGEIEARPNAGPAGEGRVVVVNQCYLPLTTR
jgi:hypothetical protein